jgi:MFS transporter, Spinster family, sphingosine-1-phosphate transporter
LSACREREFPLVVGTKVTRSYRSYLLALLLVILAFNWVDRVALGLVLEDIKADLELSDTQLGLLTGIAFAFFYSLMGIPLAHWADRGNRVTIIAVTTAIWSVAVSLCGSAASFLHLLLIRVGIAIGEAGCVPPAHSLLADYFSRAERPRALAIYMLAAPLSLFIGYFVGGWLNETYGWRVMFVLLGLPGIALAVLAWRTLNDPRFMTPHPRLPRAAPREREDEEPPTMMEVCRALWARPTFRHLLFSYAVMCFASYGVLQWQPTFFIRSHDMQTGDLGLWFAVIYGLGGLLGNYGGGEWAARRATHNERMQLRVIAVTYIGFSLLSVGIYLSRSRDVALALVAISAVVATFANGPLFATMQAVVPERMRAMSIALIYLVANLVGMGLGPLAAGVLSDAIQPWAGEESLRYALVAITPAFLWACWHLWQASATVSQDLQGIEVCRA